MSEVKLTTKTPPQQSEEPLPKFVGLPRGAALIDISVPTLRRWLTEKRLKRYKVGGHTLVETAELLSLVQESK